MRGAQGSGQGGHDWKGIIPACAGSTPRWWIGSVPSRDHPRMCGEHFQVLTTAGVAVGSSPHVRGARKPCRPSHHSSRIIPACAGSTSPPEWQRSKGRDHPRMCGEHHRRPRSKKPTGGSSPHVRGAPARHVCRRWSPGIIPACAGSTSGKRRIDAVHGDHPRMCGEHSFQRLNPWLDSGSSPHVRGARSDSCVYE